MLHIYTDGGSRGNPGKAGIGGVVFDATSNTELFSFSQYIGVATNNEAEYQALLFVLEWLVAQYDENKHIRSAEKIICFLDSKLAVEQVSRRWKIKDERMRAFAEKIWELIARIECEIVFTHIPRSENAEADLLVNQALDSAS